MNIEAAALKESAVASVTEAAADRASVIGTEVSDAVALVREASKGSYLECRAELGFWFRVCSICHWDGCGQGCGGC